MRKLLKAKYIIFSVLFLIFLIVGTKYGWLVQRYTFAETFRTSLGSEIQRSQDLPRCLRACDVKDKEFARRLLDLLTPVESHQKSLHEQWPEIKSVLLEATTRYTEKGEVRSAVEMYFSFLALKENPELVVEKDVDFSNRVTIGIEQLPVKYPRNGHVYNILGAARFQKNPRDESAILAFKKCLSILPTETSCQKHYDEAVQMFTAPFCSSSNVAQGIKVFLASKQQTELFTEEIKLEQESWFLQKSPLFDSSKIAEISLLKDSHQQEFLNVRLNEDVWQELQLKPAVSTTQTFVIQTEQATVKAGTVSESMDRTNHSLHWAEHTGSENDIFLFQTLCPKPTLTPLTKNLIR